MSDQPTLFEGRPAPTGKTLISIVFQIMRHGDWLMPWEVCNIILRDYKIRVSDSSCTARMRELRRVEFGSHTVEKRIREGSRAYEYRIVS